MFRVSMLVSSIVLLLLAACGLATPTPAPGTPLTQEQAIQIALQALAIPRPGATAVENPRNPVASLMTLREYEGRGMTLERFAGAGGEDPETLVWLVQFEGESTLTFADEDFRMLCSYAAIAVDAEGGTAIGRSYLVQPYLQPASPITREQAIRISFWHTGSLPEVTPMENPRNPVAVLTTPRQYYVMTGDGYVLPDPDAPLWVVQWEGASYSAGIGIPPRTQTNYCIVLIDGRTGFAFMDSRPFFPMFTADGQPVNATPTPRPPPDSGKAEFAALADFLAASQYRDFFQQEDSSRWGRVLMLEPILQSRGWQAVIAYDTEDFGEPKAWVMVLLRGRDWWAIDPYVEPAQGLGALMTEMEDRKYYWGSDMTFQTADEFRTFLESGPTPTPGP